MTDLAPPPFSTHARAVVRTVRGAFSDLLTAVGADADDPASIGKSFGLNRNLAWKISKIVQEDDPAVALTQMPGPGGIKIFLRSSERAGASPALVQTARSAIQDFEELIRVHSGDRATLEMMGSGLTPAGRRKRDELHRKQLFQGGSYVWGVQCRVLLKVAVVAPSATEGHLDFVAINGLIDFRRIRPDVSWVMASRHRNNDDGTPMAAPYDDVLDPNFAGPDQAPLMGDFCSQPPPQLRRVVEGTSTKFELVEGPVGNTAALTCIDGAIQRGLPLCRTPSNEWGEHSAILGIPAELLIADIYIHESLAFAIPPQVQLYAHLRPEVPGAAHARHHLPLTDALQDLGPGPQPPATPGVPRYAQLLRTVFERTAWDPAAFHGFRLKIPYPVHPAILTFRYPLPQADALKEPRA